MKLIRDTWLIFSRQMLMMWREPVWVFFGLAQPITYLLLFAPMLKLALHVGTTTDAYLVYVPGLLSVLVILGGMYTGFGLLAELRAGVIERSRVTPVSRVSLMVGRALREVVTLLGQSLVITVLALPFGLRVGLVDLLLAYLLLSLLSFMAVALSYGLTLKVRSEAALGPMINTLGQPVMLLAGVLLPLTLAPLWLKKIADANPFYWSTNAMRALFKGHIGDPSVWQALIIVGVLMVVSMIWSVRLFARSYQ
ncbi:MAG TPA: ABC transporter permease [Streptosporangiaceae bacterium]|nr:ABC transporter permease [Streptosporangiaceae bacterium]